MMQNKTPSGEICIVPEKGSRLYNLIMCQAKGSWQKEVLSTLLDNGYIIGYKATGDQLKGKAKKYQSKYGKSLQNLMYRVMDALNDNTPYTLVSDEVGPKGGMGWYISD